MTARRSNRRKPASSRKIPRSSYVVERIVEFGPIRVAEEGARALLFRVEICRSSDKKGLFFPRIHRMETFRIQPSFPQESGAPTYEPADEELMVRDEVIDAERLSGKSIAEVVAAVEAAIADRLSAPRT